MAKLSSHHSGSLAKTLGVGDSGSGKSGSIASLAKAGFQVRILDCDNGADIVRNMLLDDPAAMDRVDVETVTNEYTTMLVAGGQRRPVPKAPADAFAKALMLLDKWSDGTTPSKWGPSHFLVLDSFSFLSQQSMDYTLAQNNRLGGRPEKQHWGAAIADLEAVLQLLYSKSFNTNVLVLTHVTYITSDTNKEGDTIAVKSAVEDGATPYPNALGSKLPAKMGSYFNNMIGYQTVGNRREIRTDQMKALGFKSSNPKGVKPSYKIETGLAEFFRDLGVSPP